MWKFVDVTDMDPCLGWAWSRGTPKLMMKLRVDIKVVIRIDWQIDHLSIKTLLKKRWLKIQLWHAPLAEESCWLVDCVDRFLCYGIIDVNVEMRGGCFLDAWWLVWRQRGRSCNGCSHHINIYNTQFVKHAQWLIHIFFPIKKHI